MAAYRAGLAQHPGAHKMHNNLGRLLRRMGRQDDAIESYQAAIAARPDYAVAWFNLGNALTQKGAREKAEAAFRQAIASEPEYARAFSNLGELLLLQDRKADAIPMLREAVRLTPSEIIPRMHLAEALCRTGDHAGAHEELEASVTIAPRSSDAWTAFAAFLIRDDLAESARDPALAVVAARKAVNLAKDKRAAALVTLAEAQLVCGDVPGARQTLERAEGELAASPQPKLVNRAAAARARLEAAAAGSRPASRPDHR
jgi:tetratricopeptide (TPR) repeat protein